MNKLYKTGMWLSLILVIAAGCKDKEDDEGGTLVLHFKPLYLNETLRTFDPKPFITGQQVRFTHMSMLISDTYLIEGANDKNLDDVELVDLSFDNTQDAENGYTVKLSGIPAKTYDGIGFGIGVPADVNRKKPADFPSSNPLSKTGYYWTAWSSYIFMKTEGQLDTLDNGTFDLGFAFHTGSDPLYRILEASLPITISNGQETDLNILVDYKELFDGVDIKSKPQNHNPADSLQIQKIVNNLQFAISLQQ